MYWSDLLELAQDTIVVLDITTFRIVKKLSDEWMNNMWIILRGYGHVDVDKSIENTTDAITRLCDVMPIEAVVGAVQ